MCAFVCVCVCDSPPLTAAVLFSSASRKKTYSWPGSRALLSQLLCRCSAPTVKEGGSCLKQAVMKGFLWSGGASWRRERRFGFTSRSS